MWAWRPGDCDDARSRNRRVLSADRVVVGDDVNRVVAVRFTRVGGIAVVTLRAETDEKVYSLFYLGLSEDGDSLIDLESMDWVLQRCPFQQE